ncbi:hypothetical protein FO519_009027 [Halicephalobus sp. NKZ332]|nr:hypothetical protein FO519_009027 [Halicephalobus sp. NKZ332]
MSNKYLPLIKKAYDSYKIHRSTMMKAAGACRVVDVSEGKLKLEFDVTEEYVDINQTLHGGCIITLADVATMNALVATPRGMKAVTIDFSLASTSPAKLGDKVVIDAEIVRSGNRIAFTRAFFYEKVNQTPVAVFHHTLAFPPDSSKNQISPNGNMANSAKYLSIVKELLKSYKDVKNFQRVAGGCRVLEVTEGKVKVEFDVTEELTNPFGTLHGGCTSTLVDILTTQALIATPKMQPGVTVDLNVSCLAAAKLGETVILDAEVIRSGRSIAFTKASLYLMTTVRQGGGKFLETVRRYWARQGKNWDTNFMRYSKRCEVIYAEPNHLKFEFPVTNDVLNTLGSLHGGCTTTLLETCMSIGHWSIDETDLSNRGSTVDMHIQFLNAAREGDVLVIDVQTVKTGKNLGFFKGEVTRKSDGVVIATGCQTLAFKPKL